MTDPIKNRFRLDDDLPPENRPRSRWAVSDAGPADAYSDSDPVYLDEPDVRRRGRHRLRWIIAGGVALLLLAIGGVLIYYKFFREPSPDELAASDAAFQRLDGGAVQDRYYLPEGPFSPPLARAIELYRSLERDAARRAFEGVVNSAADDKEKSIALIYLGVMALETERYELAKHNLFRALRYDGESIPALVNLAIVERKLGNMADAKEYADRARELAPQDPRVALLLGNILAEGQDPAAAIEAYREGLSSSPDEPLLYYNMALSLLRSQRYEEALLNFARAAEKAGAGSIAVQSYAQMGQIYFLQNNLEMAADHLRKAIAFAPDNGKYRYNLGVVLLRMNRPQQATEEFQRALDAGTNDVLVYRSLSRAFEKLNQPSLAIKALEKALYLNPDDLPALFQLGDLYYGEQDLLKSADVYKRIVNITPGDSNTEDALLKLAAVYMDMERSNDAIDVLERARAISPQNPRVYFLLGSVYDRAGRRELAVDAWKKALGSNGGRGLNLSRDDERKLRIALAQVYRREGAFDLALTEYRRIRERNRESPRVDEDAELDLETGLTYLSLKDYGNAATYLSAASEANAASAEVRKEAYLRLAQAYAGTGDAADLDRARSSAARAARLDPADQSAKLLQASILLKTESLIEREKAIELLKEVTRSDVDAGTASQAFNLLGSAYMKNGEYRRALSAFDSAVQLDPSNQEAYQNQRAAANAYEQRL